MNRNVLQVADGMTVIHDYWRLGLRRGAAIKFAQLLGYTARLLVCRRWDSLLWGYLGYLWTTERGCGYE